MHAPLYRKPRHTVNGTKDSPPLSKPRPTISAKSSAGHVSRALLAEKSDTYARIVVRLNPQWRVVACADGLQWILQSRRGREWSNRYFYRSREGLVIGCHRYAADVGGDALVILLRLPNFFAEVQP
jgi:hypothetical protein